MVATTPKSENIIVVLAPASSIDKISLLRETPVALQAAILRFNCLNLLIKEEAATVLPESIQVPAIAMTGIPEKFNFIDCSKLKPPTLAGKPTLWPR